MGSRAVHLQHGPGVRVAVSCILPLAPSGSAKCTSFRGSPKPSNLCLCRDNSGIRLAANASSRCCSPPAQQLLFSLVLCIFLTLLFACSCCFPSCWNTVDGAAASAAPLRGALILWRGEVCWCAGACAILPKYRHQPSSRISALQVMGNGPMGCAW